MGPILGPLTLVMVLSGCAVDRAPARDGDGLGDGALGDGRVVTDGANTPMGDGGRSPGDGGLVPPGRDDGGGPGGADAAPIGPEIDAGPPQPPLPAALCPPLQIETGTKRAGAAVSGDWNGDGFTDLAKVETVRRVDAVNAVPGQSRLVLLYGRPDGTVDVVRSEIFEVTASLAKIQAFDLDLDGATDLMFGHGSLSFFRADGDGFAAPVRIATPGSRDVVTDFDGDGIPDIFSPHSQVVGRLFGSFMRGRGDLAFEAPVRWDRPDGSSDPRVFAIAELDGTPPKEFIVRGDRPGQDGAGRRLQIWRLEGGRWVVAQSFDLEPSQGLSGRAVVADLDGDGLADVVQRTGSATLILYGRADGTLEMAPPLRERGLVTVADLEPDGRPDILLGEGRLVHILRNDGARAWSVSRYAIPGQPAVGRFNADPHLDVVGVSSRAVHLAYGRRDGTYEATNQLHWTEFRTVLGDVDDDGKTDRFAKTFDETRLWRGRGDGSFDPVVELAPLMWNAGYRLIDLDGGGDELVSCGARELRIYPFANGQLDLANAVTLGDQCLGAHIACEGDFDGDGRLDAIFTKRDDVYRLLMARSDGAQFTFRRVWESDTAFRVHGCADFDGDGADDVLVSVDREALWVLREEAGALTPLPFVGTPMPDEDMVVKDLDGDGRADVVAYDSPNSPLTILLGRGDGHFEQIGSIEMMMSWDGTPVLTDLDGDGAPEMILRGLLNRSSRDEGALLVLRNHGDARFEPPRVIHFGFQVRSFPPIRLDDGPALWVYHR